MTPQGIGEAGRSGPRPGTVPGAGRLADRVAIVTGASRGIGRAIASRLVAEGARVVITGRGAESLAAAVDELGGPAFAVGVAGNAADGEHREQTVAAAVAAFGPLDILVNNAGTNPVYGPLLEVDDAAAAKVMAVNVVGTLGWTAVACRSGMAQRGGAIVNVASVAGIRPSPGIAFYGASKAAMISLTESLAVELAPAVRVNAVAPAVVKTRFATALYQGREEEVSARYPLRRLGESTDIAGAVAFLASDDAAWITGQTLVIDGGLTLSGGA